MEPQAKPRWALRISVTVETLTSAALLAVPSLVARLLLGVELSASGTAMARVCAIALFSLSLTASGPGLFAYNALVTIYLFFLRLRGFSGVLLLPVAFFHMLMTVLLLRGAEPLLQWFRSRREPT
jgi:hypothetical protein